MSLRRFRSLQLVLVIRILYLPPITFLICMPISFTAALCPLSGGDSLLHRFPRCTLLPKPHEKKTKKKITCSCVSLLCPLVAQTRVECAFLARPCISLLSAGRLPYQLDAFPLIYRCGMGRCGCRLGDVQGRGATLISAFIWPPHSAPQATSAPCWAGRG